MILSGLVSLAVAATRLVPLLESVLKLVEQIINDVRKKQAQNRLDAKNAAVDDAIAAARVRGDKPEQQPKADPKAGL